MSYNRLRYDQCAYKSEINQSVGPLEYILNPMSILLVYSQSILSVPGHTGDISKPFHIRPCHAIPKRVLAIPSHAEFLSFWKGLFVIVSS